MKTKEHTIHTLRELIQSRWESDMPDKVLQILRENEGKAITTRLLDKMPGGKDTWTLVRHYGWTDLSTRSYLHSQGHVGITIMLARSEASVPIDSKWIEENNAAYYSARVARNHARMEAMNTRQELEEVADAMNECERTRVAFVEAVERLQKLCAYGTHFDPDKYAILKACAVEDASGASFIRPEYKERGESKGGAR